VSTSRHDPGTEGESDGGAEILAATRAARQGAKRWRMGLPGTEPYEVRRPVWRGFAAQCVIVVSLILVIADSPQVGAAVALVSLLLGLPKTWVWLNDRISAGSWILAAVLLAGGEVAWLTGGSAARRSLAAKGSPGLALILFAICGFVALAGYLRRWGTAGQVGYTSRRLGKGDPEAVDAFVDNAEHQGYQRRGPRD
jgi:hypothetical protein